MLKAFEAIQEEMSEMSEELQSAVDYFEDTYIGRLRRNRRGKPIFELKFGMYIIASTAIYQKPTTQLRVGTGKCSRPCHVTILTFGNSSTSSGGRFPATELSDHVQWLF